MNSRKKTKLKRLPKSKIRKVESGLKGKPKPTIQSAAKDKEELIRIWDEDLCE